MKEYTKDGVKYIEYSFENWNNGSFTKMKVGEEIKTVIRTTGEKEKVCFYLPIEENEKIEQRKKELFEERVSEYLNRLNEGFNKRWNGSRDKKTLLNKEIESYESLISAEKIFVPPYDLEPQKTPIEGIQYNSRGINGIRKAYQERITDGNISYDFVTRNSYNPYLLNPSHESCLVIAESVYKYIQWLKTDKGTKQANHPDKWYAIYHLIKIKLGKEKPLIDLSKKEIVDFGKKRYHTGEGFYKGILDFDITNTEKFVRSLSEKDRKNWKGIIKEISDNDLDIIDFIEKYPK